MSTNKDRSGKPYHIVSVPGTIVSNILVQRMCAQVQSFDQGPKMCLQDVTGLLNWTGGLDWWTGGLVDWTSEQKF